ncbi:MAG: dTDP-4-dehydrorhamnose reductase [Acutalibacteraceae bacterium]
MKIIVTGAKGQLGSDVMQRLSEIGAEAIGADIDRLDITDEKAVDLFFKESRADGVIHCAAYTNVDLAEIQREICRKINADGTRNIAAACEKYGMKLLYLSTDYVFDGRGTEPFETDSPKAPCNFYGETKLEGETEAARLCKKLFIVRISWVFGENGKNFVKTMLRLASEKPEIRVVCDQTGSPTYTKDLAVLLCEMISGCKYGVYHATNEGICSWAEFADKIMELSKSQAKIIPIPSSEYKSAAVRPANSRLSKSSLDKNGFSRLPHWEDALQRFLGNEK